jgi:hypothetical protein
MPGFCEKLRLIPPEPVEFYVYGIIIELLFIFEGETGLFGKP